jgi:hypothetical protein
MTVKYKWEDAGKNNPWGRRRVRGTHCSKGHEFTEENTFVRPYDNARVCRECRKDYAKMKYQEKKDAGANLQKQKRNRPQVSVGIITNTILDKARPAWRDLMWAMEDNEPKCSGQAFDYTDDSLRFSIDEAEEMCYGCPLLRECYQFAVANEVTTGIWGGVHFDKEGGLLFDD